jgi:hypothetical protein
MTPTPPKERNWLDGNRLVEWLEANGHSLTKPIVGPLECSIRRWRGGAKCSVYQADRLLTKLGVHLHEVPDDLWVDLAPTHERYPRQVKQEAVRRVTVRDEPLKAVARSLGCDPKTVRNWIKAAA